MLIDDVTIEVTAGRGGNGSVSFNKNKMALGPTGGSGGKGGSVYLEGISDLSSLNRFASQKKLSAENGGQGRDRFRDGRDGEDLVLKVPIGTVIHNLDLGTDAEITRVGEKIIVAKGGKGGKGNFLFRSSKNTSPMQFQEGLEGESYKLRLELKFIADIGLIGFPNVGKSSFLNELTSAKSKVANYPFTTLEPNLGVYFDLILADIPGLIEGASKGKGLGIKFLRHIDRTNILFHFISSESNKPVSDWRTIRNELKKFNKNLLEKKEYIILSKTDLIPPDKIEKRVKDLKKINPNVLAFSVYDFESVQEMKKLLSKISNEKSNQ